MANESLHDPELWRKLEERAIPEPNSGCLLWFASYIPRGYGNLDWMDCPEKRAHRAAWHAVNGPIPAGMHVLHKCDVRSCINPDHLFLGTNADNVADREAKGRRKAPRGEMCGPSKLTASQIIAIRNDPRVQSTIAADYNISQGHVSRIKLGTTWGHLA